MTLPVLLTLLLVAVVLLIWLAPDAAPPPPNQRSLRRVLKRHLLGDAADHRPRPREYLTGNLPKSWPIRGVLVQANDELVAMRETLASARAVGVPDGIVSAYAANMRQAGILLNRNSDRIIHASRSGPVSPQLADALARKQRGLEDLLDALTAARGSLAALIVTGLDDQGDLDRVARSLQAWSDALGAVSPETATSGVAVEL